MSVQCYLRDACRIMNLKIFKVEIYENALNADVTELNKNEFAED